MNSGAQPPPTAPCPQCAEANKAGSRRCARCGAELPVDANVSMDPELRKFTVAQIEFARKNRNFFERIFSDFGSRFGTH